jgi:hypothetical protein
LFFFGRKFFLATWGWGGLLGWGGLPDLLMSPFGGESLPNGLRRGLLAVQEDIPLWSELSTYMFSMFIFQKIIKTLLSPKRHLMWEKGCVAINVKVEELVIPTHSNLI